MVKAYMIAAAWTIPVLPDTLASFSNSRYSLTANCSPTAQGSSFIASRTTEAYDLFQISRKCRIILNQRPVSLGSRIGDPTKRAYRIGHFIGNFGLSSRDGVETERRKKTHDIGGRGRCGFVSAGTLAELGLDHASVVHGRFQETLPEALTIGAR